MWTCFYFAFIIHGRLPIHTQLQGQTDYITANLNFMCLMYCYSERKPMTTQPTKLYHGACHLRTSDCWVQAEPVLLIWKKDSNPPSPPSMMIPTQLYLHKTLMWGYICSLRHIHIQSLPGCSCTQLCHKCLASQSIHPHL